MKNKRKVEAAVALCKSGLHIPEGSSVDAVIRNIGWLQGIQSRDEMRSFIRNVKHNWYRKQCSQKEELEKSPIKWHRLLLFSGIIIALLIAVYNPILVTVEQSGTSEPRFRICLILYRTVNSDDHSLQILPND